MKIKNFPVITIFVFAILGCTAQLPATETSAVTVIYPTSTHAPGWLPQTDAEVPRVTIEDARVALENGEAIVVDVRSSLSYEESHIAGAISIPLEVIQTDPEAIGIEKGQWIITYCT